MNTLPSSIRWIGAGVLTVTVQGIVHVLFPGDVVENRDILEELGSARIDLFMESGSAESWPPASGVSELTFDTPTPEERAASQRLAQASFDATRRTLADFRQNAERCRELMATVAPVLGDA